MSSSANEGAARDFRTATLAQEVVTHMQVWDQLTGLREAWPTVHKVLGVVSLVLGAIGISLIASEEFASCFSLATTVSPWVGLGITAVGVGGIVIAWRAPKIGKAYEKVLERESERALDEACKEAELFQLGFYARLRGGHLVPKEGFPCIGALLALRFDAPEKITLVQEGIRKVIQAYYDLPKECRFAFLQNISTKVSAVEDYLNCPEKVNEAIDIVVLDRP